jgi:hypothetical protein
VTIVGTAFSAVTDPRGHYFINHVPAGPTTLHAIFVGYRPVEVRDLRVLAGQTATLDFSLEPAPVRLQGIEVVAARNLLVPRDEVTTKQRAQGEFIARLPVDRVNDVLALLPGVTQTRLRGPLALSIRGGRPDEVVVYVDGIPVTPGYRGFGLTTPGAQISVGTNGVEEAAIVTGSSSAEFGNAQSGLVSLVTPTGGIRYTGAFGYETDEPFGVNHGLGFNRLEASLGGPLARNFTFFAAAALDGQRSAAAGLGSGRAPVFVAAGLDTVVSVPLQTSPVPDTARVPIYRFAVYRGRCDAFPSSANPGIRDNYGLPCQGIRLPWTPASTYEVQGKLTYSYGTGSRLGLSYLRSQTQGRDFDYGNLYNAQALFGHRDWSDVLTLTWTPNLARSAERALALEVYLSYQRNRSIGGPLTVEGERRSRAPFGGYLIHPLDFQFDFESFPLDQELVDNIRLNRVGTRRSPYPIESSSDFQLVDQYRNNAYGLNGWSEGGGPAGQLLFYRERRAIAKANLDWQVDRYDRLKVGVEGTRFSIGRYESELNQLGDAYLEHPERWNAFVEDRLDLGDVVVIGGLRYDGYGSRARRPFLLDTVSTSDTYGQYLNIPGAPVYQAAAQPGDPPLVVFRRDGTHGYLSPHVQVSFPVGDRTNIRLSYAHQVQAPDFALVLDGVNVGGHGADLDFGKTIGYEFGVRRAFGDDMVLDLAVYDHDNLALASQRTFLLTDPVRQRRSSVVRTTNADFGHAQGVDVRLDRRFGNVFNGTLSYSYQRARSTAADPVAIQDRGVVAINQIGGIVGPPPQAILPTASSRPHDFAGAFALTFPADWRRGRLSGALLANVGLYATARFASGTPYTPCREALASGACRVADSPNSARLPATKRFDLRLTKGFNFGHAGVTAYVDVRNLFNFTNVLRVFSVTRGTVNPRDRETRWAADSTSFAEDARASSGQWEIFQPDGGMDLRFAGAAASGCDVWKTAGGQPSAPDCVYLVRAEERYGDGDHIFSLAEQRRASEAFYEVDRGAYNFTDEPRRMRLGVEVSF